MRDLRLSATTSAPGAPIAFEEIMEVSRVAIEAAGMARISKSGAGIHWDELDEDISVAGLLAGNGDLTLRSGVAHG